MAVLTAADTAAHLDRRALGDVAWKPLVLFGLAIWLLVVGAHHEPWADEAQAWLLARDSSLGELLLERVRYEGSPGLWHALLWVLMRIGLPFAALPLISTACALAGAALILWRSPFPVALRVALLGSYVFAYQFAIVARSYALDLVLVPALAALFARRTERPFAYALLIGLLANCNAYSFLAAAVLGCDFAVALIRVRRARAVAPLSLAAAAGLFALFCAWPPANAAFLSADSKPSPLILGLFFVAEAFIDRLWPWSGTHPPALAHLHGFVLSLGIAAPSVLLFARARTWPLAGALLGVLIAFSAFVYSQAWHSGLLFLAWVFMLWVSWPTSGTDLKRLVATTAVALCLFQTIEAAATGLADVARPYSGAPAAAAALAEWRGLRPGATVGTFGFRTIAVQPFFAANIFANVQNGAAKPAYVPWRTADTWKPFPEAADWTALLHGGTDLLLVARRAMPPPFRAEGDPSLAAAGYQLVGTYPGALLWKGYDREDDTLLLFAKAPDQPAASDSSQ
jgi:hypothetical protein